MRYAIFISLLLMTSCQDESSPNLTSGTVSDTAMENPPATPVHEASPPIGEEATQSPADPDTFSNQRFRSVRVNPLGNNRYRITGQAQIFEASFGWVIEDGHNELVDSFATADRGAPDWGNFDFTIQAPPPPPNGTLHLILFETSMKDGSRQHELPI